MTPEELKEGLEKARFSIKSSEVPGSNLGVCGVGCGASALESAKGFIRENGNFCRVVSADQNRQIYDCICFSVGEWLYFVELDKDNMSCLRRVSWDKVVFFDTDLIKIK